jgi:putative hydrolase of the HAD superfamily
MLEYLKEMNLKIGMISNGYGRFQMNNVIGLQIEHYFDEILISEIEGIRKPDITIFQRALSRLGIEPHESVFVGDHPRNDVEASINAGMTALWKEDHFYERPTCANKSISQLIEIKDIIAGMMK